MKVWAVTVYTESGDDYVNVFDYKPTPEEVDEVFKDELGDEFDYISDIAVTECIILTKP